jgi:hypothetical protein
VFGDAAVRSLGRQGDRFVIVLQLDTPPHDLLTLTYHLVAEPRVDREALPAEDRTPDDHVEWLYDEFELEPGPPPMATHSILLSNGWELLLRFRDLQVTQAQAWLPPPGVAQGTFVPPSLSQPA